MRNPPCPYAQQPTHCWFGVGFFSKDKKGTNEWAEGRQHPHSFPTFLWPETLTVPQALSQEVPMGFSPFTRALWLLQGKTSGRHSRLMTLLLTRDAASVIPKTATINLQAGSLVPTEAAERGGLKTLCSGRTWPEEVTLLFTHSGPSRLHGGLGWSRPVLWLPASWHTALNTTHRTTIPAAGQQLLPARRFYCSSL